MKKKMFALSLILSAGFISQSWAVNPVPIGAQKLKRSPVTAKANLVIHGISWDKEICTQTCPQVKQDLKINKVNCNFRVRVANVGNKNTGLFAVRIRYTHWNGTSVIQKVKWLGTGLAAKGAGTWVKDVIFTNIGYYRSDKPFKVTVDWGNKVPESNESDNNKSQLMP